MPKKIINTKNAPAAIGPYSQAIAFNQLLFTAGQIPLCPETGKLVSDEIESQTRQVLENLKAVVEAGGSSLKNVVKATIFLTDLNHFAAVNQLYTEYFGDSVPARSTIQVAALPLGSLVEIEATAVIES